MTPAAGAATPNAARTWPLWFEAAAGTPHAFVAHGAGYHLALSAQGASMALGASPLRLSLVGGRAVTPRGHQPTSGVSHHFIGNDPSTWRRHVPHFSGVRYEEVYPGIDLLFYAGKDAQRATRVEYDFLVDPGADPRAIGIRLDGATDIRIDEHGQLVARSGDRAVVQRRPVAYQDIDRERRAVDVAFDLTGDTVRFRLGDYDPAHPLTIDPIVVVFGTFVGGDGEEFVEVGAENGGIAADAAGSVYIAGDSASSQVVPGGSTTLAATPNVFVAKINPAGTAVQFATFIGGNGSDTRARLALGGDGSVYVVGQTTSTDLPVSAGAIKAAPPAAGTSDAFLARLDQNGDRTYLTYFGGSSNDAAEGVAVRGTRLAVVGSTNSSNLPVTGNAAQAGPGGNFDGWVAALDLASTPTLIYCSYLGGADVDAAFAAAIDSAGRLLAAGLTDSADFPTSAGALQPTRPGGRDGFLARFDVTSGVRDYSTYFGGTGTDGVSAMSVDAADRVVIAGSTNSTSLPAGTATPFQASRSTGFDAFVARLDLSASGSAQLVYRTYLGGTANEAALAVAVDPLDRIVVGGYTASNNFPVANALQPTRGGTGSDLDGFVARLSSSGTALDYSSYLGGDGEDLVLGLVPASGFGLYVLGVSSSAAPVTMQSAGGGAAIDGTLGGSKDAFLARLDVGPTVTSITPASGSTTGGTAVTISGLDFLAGSTVTIGGAAATTVVVVNATTITAITPAGAAGARDVVVTSPNGPSATLIGGFTYVPPGGSPPSLTSVTPAQGVIVGGQQVTLTGTNFVGGATVFFGASAATGVTVVNATTIQATTPAHPPGVVSVSVVNPDAQSATLAAAFTYATDFDNDGIDDEWEVANGLDPTIPGDADEDTDNDGASNRKEFEDGTDPNVAVTRFFAEGYTGGGFSTRFALLNDDPTRTATVTFEFLVNGPVLTATRTIPPLRRLTLNAAEDVPGLADAEFSTSVRSNLEIAADRTMTWDQTTYGAHAETAVAAPASTWYLAEGATIGGFQLFYLIQNPNSVSVDVRVRYLLSGSAPVEEVVRVDPKTRKTLWVNTRTAQGISLNGQQLSAVLTSADATPIIVERAMYLDAAGQFFGAGHESAGITQPGTRWLLAEGNTGPGFDLFVLLANPNDQAANVTLTYLLPEGAPVVRTRSVPANSRDTVWVNTDPDLAATAVSTIVTADVPIIVERAMWWPASPDFSTSQWFEAHNSPGAQATAQTWVLAEGEMGVPNLLDTYILLANTSSRAGRARVRLIFEDGTLPVAAEFPLNANSRKNVRVGFDIGDLTLIGKRFGAIVESVGDDPVELVVERAMYWTTGTQFYGAGTNALAKPK